MLDSVLYLIEFFVWCVLFYLLKNLDDCSVVREVNCFRFDIFNVIVFLKLV